ncbi:MAG: AgmX/PglI C-terminal domain-containing protein [Proteobacteria bacterium]|nr:AgmX/PglI C-terminal domain-containing protein [Pseudomonadota bacterium]
MPSHQPKKLLRIGVFRGKQCLEERVVKKRQTVSFGQDESNTFCVLSSSVPKKAKVFVHDASKDAFTLNIDTSVKGRVFVKDGKSFKLEDIKRESGVSIEGNKIQIALTDSSRGKLVFGKITILFQFVHQRDDATALLLADQQKKRFSVFSAVFFFALLFSFLLHIVPLLVVSLQDWPQDDETIALPSWFKPEIVQLKIEDDEDPPEEPDLPELPVDPLGEFVQTEVITAEPSGGGGGDPGASTGALMERITDAHRQQGAMITSQILGIEGGDVGSYYANMLGGNAHIADMSDIAAGDIGGAGGTGNLLNQLASASGGAGGGSGSAGLLGIGSGEGTGGPRVVVSNAPKEPERARVQFSVKDQSEFTAAAPAGSKESIERMFVQKKNDITSCYQRAMNAQGRAQGRFVIAITVTKEGTVLKVDKIEDQIGGDMFTCVRQRIMNWKFGTLQAPIAFKKTWVFS